MDEQRVRVVMATFPDAETARRVGRQLVEEGLIACLNLLPHAESIYRWRGVVEVADEVVVFMKTAADRFDDLRVRFKQLHPYEVPELLALEVVDGLPDYLQWVLDQSRKQVD